MSSGLGSLAGIAGAWGNGLGANPWEQRQSNAINQLLAQQAAAQQRNVMNELMRAGLLEYQDYGRKLVSKPAPLKAAPLAPAAPTFHAQLRAEIEAWLPRL